MKSAEDMIEEEVNSTIEDFQEVLMEAGGQFFRRKRLDELSLTDLIKTCVANNIIISLEYCPDLTEECCADLRVCECGRC